MRANLKYSTKQINKEFIIRVWFPGSEKSKLIGVSTFLEIVGEDLANKLLDRAMNPVSRDKCVCKLRRGIQIDFVNH